MVSPAAKFLEKTTHCCPSSLKPSIRVTSLEQVPDESTVSGQAPSPLRHYIHNTHNVIQLPLRADCAMC